MSDIEDDVQAFLWYYREVIRLRGVDQALQEAVEDCVRHRRKYADYLYKVQALETRLAEVEAQAAKMREVLEEALPAGESGWWCPTCTCEVPDVEVTFEGYHDACGTYIKTVNQGAWRDRARAAIASDAGRETAERLRLLEELAEAATAFTERCTLGECHSRHGEPICDEDPCLVQRLKAVVKALKGGNANAGAKA